MKPQILTLSFSIAFASAPAMDDPIRLDTEKPISLLDTDEPFSLSDGLEPAPPPALLNLPWTGLELAETDPLDAALFELKTTALRVNAVQKESPGAKAGLEKGDLILSWEHSADRGIESFFRSLASMEPGTELKLEIQRKKKRRKAVIVLGERRPLTEPLVDFKNVKSLKKMFDSSAAELEAMKKTLQKGIEKLPGQEGESSAPSPKSDN